MESISLNATVREDFGKGAARKFRRKGLLPVVVYREGSGALPLTIASDELEAIFRKTQNRNTLIKLEAGKDSRVCLVKEVQRHPVSQQLWHVDFYEVSESETVEVIVKVTTVGTAIGTKMGGKLRIVRRTVKVVCKPEDIPAQVELDVSSLNVGDILRVSAVEPPSGCKIVYNHDFNIVTVVGKRGAKAAAEAAAAEAEE